MNILDKIISHKLKEVDERKIQFPVWRLQKSIYFNSTAFSLKEFILREDKTGIIGEFKRKSPSRGVLHASADVSEISAGYALAGASALSVLTDHNFFGGSNHDLEVARTHAECPVLRKDFVLDEYQIIEAKSIGADAILLIAAVLPPEKIKALSIFAHSIGLEVLLEVHSAEELMQNADAPVDLMGVNNRNLKTFEVSVETSKTLFPLIPKHVVKVSESGIDDPITVHELLKVGFQGFLIGQKFMEQPNPVKACKAFIDELNKLKSKPCM